MNSRNNFSRDFEKLFNSDIDDEAFLKNLEDFCYHNMDDEDYVKKIRKIFIDKELTKIFFQDLMDAISKKLDVDHCSRNKLFYKNRQKYTLETLDILFECCESPIEKIFLNTILIYFLYQSAYFLYQPLFASSSSNTSTTIKKIKSKYQESIFVCQEFDKEWDDNDPLKGVFEIMYFQEARLDTHRYNNYHFIIQPQFPDLIIQNRSIRADLLIWKPSNDFKLIVECDGYKYHSDEESFSRDRKRDRLFKLHGYEVFRFSGKEICNEPYKCSKDLFDYLIKKET
jgi:hypothetical protein